MTRAQDDLDVDTIVDMLRARIPQLIREWGLQGFQQGTDFLALNGLRGDRHIGSFRVGLAGKFQGMLTDFAGEVIPGTGKKSCTPLTYIAYWRFGGDMGQALKWSRDWLGLSGHEPAKWERCQASLQLFRQRPMDSAEDQEKKRRSAQRIYLTGGPWIDSPAQAYYAGRGIDLAKLPFLTDVIRFSDSCYCSDLGYAPDDPRAFLPAILLPFTDEKGTFKAVHRTYLMQSEDGRWGKAALKSPKKIFGSYVGAFIPLWKGSRVLPSTGEIVQGRSLSKAAAPIQIHLTEGAENGWSVVMAYPDARVHVAGSVSNLKSIAYPDSVTSVVLWRDGDAPGSAAARSFDRAVKNFQAQGKDVLIADVSAVAAVKDVNDLLRIQKNGQ